MRCAASEPPWDAISLEIMWQRLLSCADQAAATLLRTSFSTVVAASHDFRCAITDSNGNSLAQSYYGEVMFVTSFPDCVKNMIAAMGRDSIRPGDVYLTNDPWLAAGHLPDIHVATPVFFGGRLVAFSGSVIHISDIGGRFGAHDAGEVFEEGLCFPVVRLYEGGKLNSDILAILRANVRVPELAEGDVRAQVAANAVGARLLVEFLEEYGLSDLEQLSNTLLGRVEAAMRAQIAALPDGRFDRETRAETGIATDDVVIRSTITVAGDEIAVDYTGSSPQTQGVGVNCVLNCTRSLTLFPLHAALLPEVPSNEGMSRPIRITAPPGSVMNAQRPAPVDVRAMITHLLPDHVLGSIAELIPERVTAGSGIRWMLLADRVRADGSSRTISSFFQAGGMGASGRRDGPNARFFPIRARHTAVERFELDTGLVVERKAVRQDSGGPGRHRGGCGQDIELVNPGPDTVRFSFYRPQTRHGARGYFGGLDGRPGRVRVNGEDLSEGVLTLSRGERATLETPGGGGFGDPADRDVEAVRDDVLQGYVSGAEAARAYGAAARPVFAPGAAHAGRGSCSSPNDNGGHMSCNNLFTNDEFSDPIEIAPGVRTRVLTRGELMFSLVELDEGAVSEIHRHPEVQMGLVLEGAFERRQGDELKLLQTGDGFYVPPDVPHGGRAQGGRCRILDVFSPPRRRYVEESSSSA